MLYNSIRLQSISKGKNEKQFRAKEYKIVDTVWKSNAQEIFFLSF